MSSNSPTIPCPISINAQTIPQKPALLWGTRKITWDQLDGFVTLTVRQLKKRGVIPGKRIAIADEHSVEYLIILLGLWRLGAVACPISPRLPEEAVVRQLQKIHVQTLVSTHEPLLHSKKIAVPKIHLQDLICFDAREGFYRADGKTAEIPLDRPATVIWTSGSSGEPKAALHSYGNHFYNAQGANEAIELGEDDRWLLSLPLYHVAGIGIVFRCLISGAAIVVDRERAIEETIDRYKITHVSLVTTQLYRLLSVGDGLKPFPTLKAVLLGGSAFPQTLLDMSLRAGLPIYLSYGLTEMASQVATAAVTTEGACAKVLPNRTVRISNEGEIMVGGAVRFEGYVQGDQLLRPFNTDGEFATGDLGIIDARGCLKVLGRKDNMFISGGENIQPEEIEKILLEVGEIRRAFIVPAEDKEFGQRPVAFVAFRGNPLAVSAMKEYLARSLPKFKIPDRFYTIPSELAENQLKISRTTLKSLLTDQLKPLA